MIRPSDLINVHLKEVEAVIAQSGLLLQKKENGQSGELKSSGDLVETYIRNFLRQISPEGIRITSGYIVNSLTFKSKQNLSQHDIILSNKNTPPLFSIIENKIAIVPVESMVGIIEIKRNLTKESIKQAQSHIKKTYEEVIKDYKTKDLDNNTFGITTMPSTLSPMFGIIGLTSELSHEDIKELIDPDIIDFVWAFQHDESFVVGDFNGKCTGTISRKDINQPRMLSIKGENTVVFSKVKGIIRFWLSSLASQWMKADSINGYYIDIWDNIEKTNEIPPSSE
ncbi:DUF6602 domain-containing protein [Flavobacterium sp. AG291]|uniref:DUF6602 domain-containing protein n=1 Tax=Flavobacterium sp. AG291 TaxID=2184000 RepID=UPI000E0BCE90|nr:DUF6602 domain-containing protein [Flavobacterium sp. AG291]RDI13173.1 hypothetical protein DEU42_10383 [Flavobacterium sp. AG291]